MWSRWRPKASRPNAEREHWRLSRPTPRSSTYSTSGRQSTVSAIMRLRQARNAEQFFFFFYPDPRDLHSFPTRRSSDLNRALVDRAERRLKNLDFFKDVKITTEPRSEEHTSELQSPDHLVCRLLLEK